MAAAPKNALLTFRGDQTGRQYAYSVYFSDVAAAFTTWSLSGAAGTSSTNFISAPENMTLIDASVPTGLTDTTTCLLWINDAPAPGNLIQYANIVNTLASRSFPVFRISQGRKVQLQQLA